MTSEIGLSESKHQERPANTLCVAGNNGALILVGVIDKSGFLTNKSFS